VEDRLGFGFIYLFISNPGAGGGYTHGEEGEEGEKWRGVT
jgi:hypothetical protein